MNPRIWVCAEAQREVAEAAAWYERRKRGLGREFVAAVSAAQAQIAKAPLRSPCWVEDDPARRLVMHRFPYIVVYDVEDNGVLVLAVAHTHRSPGYWRERR